MAAFVPQPFSFTSVVDDTVGTFCCKGEADAFSVVPLRALAHQMIDGGCTRLIFDLSGVTYMDSSGVRVLVELYKRLVEKGGVVDLVGCNRTLVRLFKITQLVKYFRFWDSLEEAQGFTKAPIEEPISGNGYKPPVGGYIPGS